MTGTTPYQLWNTQRSTWADYDVVGESFHMKEITSLFPRGWDRHGHELQLDLQIVPEPDNPHGTYALSVRAGAKVLGYIAHGDSAQWAPVIYRIAASGCTATTPGRIWIGEIDDWNNTDRHGNPRSKVIGRVQIRLGDPATALPLNDPPQVPYTMVPRSSIVQVTKESEHFDALFEFVPESGHGLLFATLHADTITTPRTTKSVVEVRIDGERIGQLTAQMSQRFLPMVEHLASRGLATACWADITGSSIAAEVRIDAVKANEADEDILDGPARTVPTLVPERNNPDEYDVPDAYTGADKPKPRRAPKPAPSVAPPAPAPPPESTPPVATAGDDAPAASTTPREAPAASPTFDVPPQPAAAATDGWTPPPQSQPPVPMPDPYTPHGRIPRITNAPGFPAAKPPAKPRGRWKSLTVVFLIIVVGGLILTAIGGMIAPALGAVILLLTLPAAIAGTIWWAKNKLPTVAGDHRTGEQRQQH